MKFFASLFIAALAETDAQTRIAVIQEQITSLTSSMPQEGGGSQFTQKFSNRLNKLISEMTAPAANLYGTDCSVGSGGGSGDGPAEEGDDLTAFNTGDSAEDKCQLNKQINRALNSYVRNYVCDGRGNHTQRMIRRLRKVKNWYNVRNDCSL
ncbi:unnamed protein product [Oikopleura dioica]|uniref:Uncharacterized protein n=1 Tax=Oikopleura dioica TaxID=34765 RepID=E4XEE5_OIKDI|nr:unnamed protein product [Oikopleura dioica]